LEPGDPVLVDKLLRFARAAAAPPVVLCDSDEALDFLSENRDRLEPPMRLAVPDRELVVDLADKRRFLTLAERYGLPVPRARVIDASDGSRAREVGLRFPVVLKPAPHRDNRWGALEGPEKALYVASADDLEAVCAALRRAGIDLVAQEFVPGPEDRVVSYHVYVDANGDVAGEFTGRKIRTLPLERGMSTALVTTDDPAVAELGRELVRRLDFRGAAKLDFKRAPDGSLLLLEINPRFTLWAHAGAVAGVNLPALAYADAAGLPRPAPVRARPGVRWISLRRDRAAARAAGIPLSRWALWAARCETKNSSFAWTDPGPALGRFRRGRRWEPASRG
jgi:predicted ATP-grasp superfamily ATP-dependent carboligase